MFITATQVLQFSRLDDLQNSGFDRLKIVELSGPVFWKLREVKAEGNISYNIPISHCHTF